MMANLTATFAIRQIQGATIKPDYLPNYTGSRVEVKLISVQADINRTPLDKNRIHCLPDNSCPQAKHNSRDHQFFLGLWFYR